MPPPPRRARCLQLRPRLLTNRWKRSSREEEEEEEEEFRRPHRPVLPSIIASNSAPTARHGERGTRPRAIPPPPTEEELEPEEEGIPAQTMRKRKRRLRYLHRLHADVVPTTARLPTAMSPPGAFEHVSAPAPPTPPIRRDRRSIPPIPPAEQDHDPAASTGTPIMPPASAPECDFDVGASTVGRRLRCCRPRRPRFELKRQQEILDEEEGDPIDPAFHSPSRRTSTVDLQAVRGGQAQAGPAEPVRRTPRRVMAKLGGVKFWCCAASEDEHSAPPVDADAETEERARKERIAAKLAGMGGMRIGMMPFGAGGPPQQSRALGEAEESEIEEIRHEDAEEEEVPPPVPDEKRPSYVRPSEPTRQTSQPPVPAGRPPCPLPCLKVHQPREKPPPKFHPRLPPPRTGPPPPPPPGAMAPSDSVDSMTSSQWELPSIPNSSLDFGGGIDTSFSSFERTATPPAPPKPNHPQSSQQPPAVRTTEVHYSADDLVAIWGRVGVHLCEAATQLYEKSKKSLVGDGTYTGFVNAALHEVPNAARTAPPAWGYLVYSQAGSSLKGHKGIATYSQDRWGGEPLVGIVSEFEPKKSKIRHVGHQTVEASGIVKVGLILASIY
ncbi:hypothetical protein C8F04DRAFT_1159009, partial [Mycena alexandri]